ncbi:lectin-like domain-containing protein [Enterococcus phoeniculicola]|nr:hypothetical protein [Enterococcus phoeniculicola]
MILLLGLAGLFIIVFGQTISVDATNESSPPPHIELTNIFQLPAGSNSQLIPTADGDIVQLTDTLKNQNGAIWSTPNNMMDLTKDFESSMYIYFGDQGTSAADGMAFVMQNDPSGPNKIVQGDGAQLGVWDSSSYGVWDKGIKNSFAVEFDTHDNANGGFDTDVSGDDHVAWNFPGDRSMYHDYTDVGDWFKKKRYMDHRNTQYPGELSTDKWIPFNIKWSSQSQTLTYQFNNMAPVAVSIDTQNVFKSTKVYWGFTGSTGAQIEMNRMVFETVPGLVNASLVETIVDDAGNSVEQTTVNSGQTLTYRVEGSYLSGKQEWKDVLANLQISGNVTYVPGSLKGKSTGNVEVPLPDSSWNGNQLQVNMGTLNATENLAYLTFKVKVNPVSALAQVSENSVYAGKNHIEASNFVNYSIAANTAPELTLDNSGTTQTNLLGNDYTLTGKWKDLDGTKGELHYLVNGKESLENADTVTADTWTAYSHTISASDLVLGKNTVEVYVIDSHGAESAHTQLTIQVKAAPELTVDDEGKTIKLEYGVPYSLKGTWSDKDSPTAEFYYEIDGQVVGPIKEQNPVLGADNPYTHEIDGKYLTIGLHKVTVYIIDPDKNKSTRKTLTIEVNGTLSFTNVASKVSFQTTEVPLKEKMVARNKDWDIRVKDTRGVGGNWHVDLTLDHSFSDGGTSANNLNEGLIYRKGTSNTDILPGVSETVFTNTTTNTSEVPVTWKDNEGILLLVNSADYAGVYTGTLNWTLVDGP